MGVFEEDLERIPEGLSGTERASFAGAAVLVTGCAGSLGYELCGALKRLGAARIIGIDSCRVGRPEWIGRFFEEPGYEFYEKSIEDVDLHQLDGAEAVTHVFHMASIASPMYYREMPLETMDANVEGCRNLLDFYAGKDLKAFVYFSSSEIYGNPDPAFIPTPETYWGNVSCVGPRACYDESKRYTETLCEAFAKKYGMPCVILRPFNIFGPGMKLNDQRIGPDCARAVLEGRDMPIFSDGTPSRTFCYMSDAIVWILKAAAYGRYEVFNIGIDGPELTVEAYAEMFAAAGRELTGYQGRIVYRVSEDADYLTHNPQRRCPDLTHSRSLLGYEPRVTTAEGVKRYLRFLIETKEAGENWVW